MTKDVKILEEIKTDSSCTSSVTSEEMSKKSKKPPQSKCAINITCECENKHIYVLNKKCNVL